MMKELIDSRIYELLDSEYNRVMLDYVVLSCDEEYEGEKTHKKGIIEALKILSKRFDVSEYSIDTENMTGQKTEPETFLELPGDEYYETRQEKSRTYNTPVPMPYWFAFLEPPHGNKYTKDDFLKFNEIIISDKKECEIYIWNDEFSDYFDEGKEWWGTGMWSVFDKKTNNIIIIGASLTD